MMMQTNKVKVKFIAAYKDLFDKRFANNNYVDPQYRYFIYYGGRASGKSHQVALSLILRGRTKKLLILCTREIQKTIKDSVFRLLVDIIEQYGFYDYTYTKDSIKNVMTGTEFIFTGLHNNVNEIKSMANVDVCWVEEAQSITTESIEVLTPTIRKDGSQIIFTFNRYTELDPVFVKFVLNNLDGTFIKQVNFDVLEKQGLLSKGILQEIENDKNNPALYAHKWLGEPITQDEFSILPRDRVLSAMQRTIEPEGRIECGVDVARMGGDRSVFWLVHGLKTIRFEVHEKKKTTELCDLLEKFLSQNQTEEQIQQAKSIPLRVDDTGVGGGVSDEMEKRGYFVIRINFGASPNEKNKYPNLISEAWFSILEHIDVMELPMNKDLLMELTTRVWKQDNKGRRVVESKQDYKKRGYRSPDLADACILAYYRDAKTHRVKTYNKKPQGF